MTLLGHPTPLVAPFLTKESWYGWAMAWSLSTMGHWFLILANQIFAAYALPAFIEPTDDESVLKSVKIWPLFSVGFATERTRCRVVFFWAGIYPLRNLSAPLTILDYEQLAATFPGKILATGDIKSGRSQPFHNLQVTTQSPVVDASVCFDGSMFAALHADGRSGN